MPPASRTRWRLGPGLPFPGPNGGLVLRSHRCLPSSNRSGHARVDVPAWLGATLPNAIGIQVTQAPPAGHTTAVTQGLRQVFPWDACLQHEQNAIERCFIAHGELACATSDGRREGWDQGLQLSPQFFANGLSCHEGQKHKCFWLISKVGGVSSS